MSVTLNSVLLVDDQQLFRDGLELILKQTYPTIGIQHAENGPIALQMLQTAPVDLVLLDIGMPEMNGMDVATHIVKNFPSTIILVVTQYDGEAMIRQLLYRGVHGFIFKSSSADEIRKAIDTVVSGKQYLPPSLNSSVVNNWSTSTPPVFNKREAEILIQLKMGRSSKEIAENMKLKENTINSYREDMLQKTKTKNVAELISYAYENGLLG